MQVPVSDLCALHMLVLVLCRLCVLPGTGDLKRFLIKHYFWKQNININTCDFCTLWRSYAPNWTCYAQFWLKYRILDIVGAASLIDTIAYI